MMIGRSNSVGSFRRLGYVRIKEILQVHAVRIERTHGGVSALEYC